MVDDHNLEYHVIPECGSQKVAKLVIQVSKFDVVDNLRFFLGSFCTLTELVNAYGLTEMQGDMISDSINDIECSTDISNNTTFQWHIPRFAFNAVINELDTALTTIYRNILGFEIIGDKRNSYKTGYEVWEQRKKSVIRILALIRMCLDNEINTARTIAVQNKAIRDAKFQKQIIDSVLYRNEYVSPSVANSVADQKKEP